MKPTMTAIAEFDLLAAALALPAGVFDANGDTLFLNEAWRDLIETRDTGHWSASWTELVAAAHDGLAWSQVTASNAALVRVEAQLRGTASTNWYALSLQRDAINHTWLCTCTDISATRAHCDALAARVHLQAALLDGSDDCIKMISTNGNLIFMNRAGCDALGVPRNSSFGMPWLPLLPPDVRDAGERALACARSGNAAQFPGCSVLPGEPMRFWQNSLLPIRDDAGDVHQILCVSHETTAQREAQDALRQSLQRLSVATRIGGLGVWDFDIERGDLICDDTWYEIIGIEARGSIRSVDDFKPYIHPDDVERATEPRMSLADMVANGGEYSVTFRIIRPGGETRWIRSVACLIQDLSRTTRRAIGFIVDITDAVQSEAGVRDTQRRLAEERDQFAQQSIEDALTGIPNRRHLFAELEMVCQRATRSGNSVVVAMIDVDHFKSYNDFYGHLQGDRVLCRIANALRHAARRGDVVARFGGEEFACVLEGVEAPALALNRFIAAVEDLAIPHANSPHGRITISAGCVVRRGRALDPQSLLEAADDALYEAKAAGRNRVVIWG